MNAPPPPALGDPARQHYGLTLGVLLIAALAFSLQQTMVVPALPAIRDELGTSTTTVTFVLTAFLLTASVSTPIMGRLGDMFGKDRMLVVALSAFAVGSLVCALSHSIGVLIAGRGDPGDRGGGLPARVRDHPRRVPADRVSTGIGMISATFGIGGGAGLVLSGVIVDNLAYEWIFWLGLRLHRRRDRRDAFLLGPGVAAEEPGEDRLGRRGAALRDAVALLVGVSEANSWGWGSARILGLFGAAAVLFAVWVALRAPPATAARRHLDDARARRADDEHHGDARRLRDVRLVHPHPAARPAAGVDAASASARRSPRRGCSCSRRRR